MSVTTEGNPLPKNMPIWTLISAVVLVITLGIILLVTPPDRFTSGGISIFIALVVSTVPSLIAAATAERTSKDIRNGVVVEKAREGAVQAIQETEVLTLTGPVATSSFEATHAAVGALTELLRRTDPLVTDKTALAGATHAIADTEVLTRSGPVADASLAATHATGEALTELLRRSDPNPPTEERGE